MVKKYLTESEVYKLISKLTENIDDILPIKQARGNIEVKYETIELILQDLRKSLNYFEENRVINNPEYSDKLNRLKRGVKTLEKITR